MDQMHRNGERVIALGETCDKDVGAETPQLVLDYAFPVTNLRCMYQTVINPNFSAIRACGQAEFKRQAP